MTTVEVGNEWADGVNEWRRDTFDERGARAFACMIDREHRADSTSDERDREFWRESAEYWHSLAIHWWTFAAECAAKETGS